MCSAAPESWGLWTVCGRPGTSPSSWMPSERARIGVHVLGEFRRGHPVLRRRAKTSLRKGLARRTLGCVLLLTAVWGVGALAGRRPGGRRPGGGGGGGAGRRRQGGGGVGRAARR